MMREFENRGQQRMVTETMDGLLCSIKSYTDKKTQESIDVTLRILRDTPVRKRHGVWRHKEVHYSNDMPDFKGMTMDEIMAIAVERGLDVSDFEQKYPQEQIRRMRLTMAIRKTYEVDVKEAVDEY